MICSKCKDREARIEICNFCFENERKQGALEVYNKFWNHRAKWFVVNELIPDGKKDLNYFIISANNDVSDYASCTKSYTIKAQAFLDCVNFFGKKEIKKRIKELEEGKEGEVKK